jgi:integrase/recombinase XerD
MPPKGWRKPVVGDADDPEGLIAWTRRYVDDLRVKGYSKHTLVNARGCLNLFIEWAFHRGLTRPHELTRQVVEHYQRAVFEGRKPDGRPLTLSSQRARLQKLRGFCKWMAKTGALPFNPAGEVELPRVEQRLPRAVLGEKEVEQLLALPDLDTPTGVRDRAMMEVLYSTGIRRTELTSLRLADIDDERGTLSVRLGKGKKDRVVPIGERALAWLDRYLQDVRPSLVAPPDDAVVFLTAGGKPVDPARLTNLMRAYVKRADLGKSGACHIFRHAMATLMLEGGADVRVIQEILGHAELSTTEIYTRVSIGHLKAVHDRTHPGAKLEPSTPVPADRTEDDH